MLQSKPINRRYSSTRGQFRKAVVYKRSLGLNSQDLLFASFPKSGSTWLRFVLTMVFTGQEVDFDQVQVSSPSLGSQKGGMKILSGGGRLVKSHEHPIFWHGPSRRPRVLWVVRDGRDVAKSYYHHWVRAGAIDESFEQFFPRYVKGETGPFGSWQSHTRRWLRYSESHPGSVACVRYEDLLRSPSETLHGALRLLGEDVAISDVERAFVLNSADRMRNKEAGSRHLKETSTGNMPFVRSARSEGWREELSDKQVRLFEAHARQELLRLDYPISEQ